MHRAQLVKYQGLVGFETSDAVIKTPDHGRYDIHVVAQHADIRMQAPHLLGQKIEGDEVVRHYLLSRGGLRLVERRAGLRDDGGKGLRLADRQV